MYNLNEHKHKYKNYNLNVFHSRMLPFYSLRDSRFLGYLSLTN